MSKLDQMVAQGVCGSSQPGSPKARFHNTAKRILRKVASESLELEKGDYDLSSNVGGVAVSGEITLHSDSLYIQVSESIFGTTKASVLVRRCNGRKDFTGEVNNFCPAVFLEDTAGFRRWLKEHRLIPSVMS